MTRPEVRHTPGPWRVNWYSDSVRIPGSKPIVFHNVITFEVENMAEVDAPEASRLIAAAPEMLEALRLMLDCWDSESLLTDAVVNRARAIIAAASGENEGRKS